MSRSGPVGPHSICRPLLRAFRAPACHGRSSVIWVYRARLKASGKVRKLVEANAVADIAMVEACARNSIPRH
jgi:hypothetical protein